MSAPLKALAPGSVADRLRRARLAAGYRTATDAAIACANSGACHPQSYMRWESGGTRPTPETLAKVVAALFLDPSYFRGDIAPSDGATNP